MHRFYAPDLESTRSSVALPADEAQHVTRVLRLSAGAIVAVFDGRGAEFTARIQSARGDRVSLEILEPRRPAAEPHIGITLAQSVLKGDKMDEVVRDAVMVGAVAIQPVVSSRTEVSLAMLRRAGRSRRWRRVAVTSAKQCGRAVVPQVLEPVELAALPTDVYDAAAAVKIALIEPSQHHADLVEVWRHLSRPAQAVVLVGPEGGWSGAELEALASAGYRLMTLGSRTLRADAVAIVGLTLLQFVWGDL